MRFLLIQGKVRVEQLERCPCESAMEWRRIVASRHCPLVPLHRLVVICLSFFGNCYGENIFPSQASIAERAGTCRKTVLEATQRAYEAGFLDRWQIGTGQGYKRYEYALTLPANLATELALNPDFMKEVQGRRRVRRTQSKR